MWSLSSSFSKAKLKGIRKKLLMNVAVQRMKKCENPICYIHSQIDDIQYCFQEHLIIKDLKIISVPLYWLFSKIMRTILSWENTFLIPRYANIFRFRTSKKGFMLVVSAWTWVTTKLSITINDCQICFESLICNLYLFKLGVQLS